MSWPGIVIVVCVVGFALGVVASELRSRRWRRRWRKPSEIDQATLRAGLPLPSRSTYIDRQERRDG